jgi:hypothetical protein
MAQKLQCNSYANFTVYFYFSVFHHSKSFIQPLLQCSTAKERTEKQIQGHHTGTREQSLLATHRRNYTFYRPGDGLFSGPSLIENFLTP